ncbi:MULTISPECIES: MEDS domain-containing protein [unclassified Blastococcus]
MTAPRRLGTPTGLRPGDHLCWSYAGADELAAAVLPYLEEGRRLGEHLLVVGESRDDVDRAVAGLPDRDALLAGGQLELRTTADAYTPAAGLEPAAQVESYRTETRAALARGRTGLRVAADVTPLARGGPEARRRLHAYEQLADELMESLPMTALCLYDAALGDDVVGPLAVLHPGQHHGGRYPLAHLSGRGARLSLHGEVDVSVAADVARALADVVADARGEVELDLADLEFLDVAGARAIAGVARRLAARGVRLRLVGARRSAARCLALFGLSAGPAEPA